MPAAIEQDFVMAWTNNDNDDIEIANIDKDQYPQEKLSTDLSKDSRRITHGLTISSADTKQSWQSMRTTTVRLRSPKDSKS